MVLIRAGQVTLPRAGHPADDLPHKAGNPADPLHPPVQLRSKSDLLSAVAQTSPKTIARPSDQPGSPAGWGAVDPTWAYSDSDEEL
jgi:hypothetical protein